MPILNQLRLRYGLFWGWSYPTLKNFKFLVKPLVVALIVLTVVMTTAYSKSQANTDRVQQSRDNAWSQFIDCLNGEWRGRGADGSQVACYKAENLESHNVSRKHLTNP
jgi:ABC-type transport system involved in cytochrome bd biosynthesis fused ATPase/permease subunit